MAVFDTISGGLLALATEATPAAAATETVASGPVINLLYLVAAVLFILGIKRLSHPRTAVQANKLGATAMLIAVSATFWNGDIDSLGFIFAGLIVGSAIGIWLAKRTELTEMPELVALFNGFGGLASILVAGATLIIVANTGPSADVTVAIAASGFIGALTFWGSLVAYAKLSGKWISGRATIYAMQNETNILLMCVCVAMGVWVVADPTAIAAYWALVVFGSVLGVTSVIRIGGGDMPVVIALLNSYSGLAAAATGFVLANSVLIVAGSLVGASGLILTAIMCKAMNRSLTDVLFGVLAPTGGDGPSADDVYAGKVKSTSADEVAMLFDGAQRVVFVPGYGMAVAQAQHAVRDLANELISRGVEIEYAIHPVAGRMPGHMNVLLAEADVPYDQLKEMDEINPTLPQVDVAIVIGANDVVNPVARTDPSSPIAGMPIVDVDKCRTVVIIKRSLSPGFAGIPNPLFAADNALMFFGDGKKNILDLTRAVKEN